MHEFIILPLFLFVIVSKHNRFLFVFFYRDGCITAWFLILSCKCTYEIVSSIIKNNFRGFMHHTFYVLNAFQQFNSVELYCTRIRSIRL